ncbi:MAG: DUF5658 family protein [Armatimonadota bacterium]|nr:DUF5658 family protein [Armatimonadota bacterium]
MSIRISRESALLAAICIVDTLLTALLVQFRVATEQNPLMAVCLDRGTVFFIAAKILSFAPFLVVAEIHKRRNPVFVRKATWMAIALYLGIYSVVFLRVNIFA